MANILSTAGFRETYKFRKHHSQMTDAELDVIERTVNGRKFYLSDHAESRLRAKNIYREDVFDAIKNGQVIETNRLAEKDVRVLLRDEFKDGSAVCVVLSLADGAVVTAYENNPQEVHQSDFEPDKFYGWRDDMTVVVANVLNTNGLR
jgi:hypothetical protein